MTALMKLKQDFEAAQMLYKTALRERRLGLISKDEFMEIKTAMLEARAYLEAAVKP